MTTKTNHPGAAETPQRHSFKPPRRGGDGLYGHERQGTAADPGAAAHERQGRSAPAVFGKINATCSKLPRAVQCASSLIEPEINYSPPNEDAQLGKVVHQAMVSVVANRDPDLDALIGLHDVDRDQVDRLVAYGRQAWSEIATHFPEPRTEVELKSDLAPGHADVLHHDGKTCVVADWKSGWARRDHQWQLGGYAYAARHTFGMPESGKITTIVVWLRHGEIEVKHWTGEHLDQFAYVVRGVLKAVGKHYGPGEACEFCPRRIECPARAELLRSTGAALIEQAPAELTPEKLAGLYYRAKQLSALLDQYNSSLRDALGAGPLPLPDGKVIELQHYDVDQINARAAWPVLKDTLGFQPNHLAEITEIRKGRMLEIVGESAPPRGKATAQRKAMAALEQAGAIFKSRRSKIQVRDADKPKGDPKETT